MEIAQDAPSISLHNGKGKLRLLTRELLDGRTKASKQFDAIARGIAADLGGEDRLTTIQRFLVEAFAGAALQVNDFNAKLLLGEDVDLLAHSQAITTLVRVASRLPHDRHQRDVTTLGSLIRQDQEEQRARLAREHDEHERAAQVQEATS